MSDGKVFFFNGCNFIGCVQLFLSSQERARSIICARCGHILDNGPAVEVRIFLRLVRERESYLLWKDFRIPICHLLRISL